MLQRHILRSVVWTGEKKKKINWNDYLTPKLNSIKTHGNARRLCLRSVIYFVIQSNIGLHRCLLNCSYCQVTVESPCLCSFIHSDRKWQCCAEKLWRRGVVCLKGITEREMIAETFLSLSRVVFALTQEVWRRKRKQLELLIISMWCLSSYFTPAFLQGSPRCNCGAQPEERSCSVVGWFSSRYFCFCCQTAARWAGCDCGGCCLFTAFQ